MALKYEEQLNMNSCLNKADYYEPVFVLRANDELAPNLVRDWARRYSALKGAGMTAAQSAKFQEAVRLADTMDTWRMGHSFPSAATATEFAKYSEPWLRTLVVANGYSKLLHHDCGGCKYWVRYLFLPPYEESPDPRVGPRRDVFFDPSCNCSSHHDDPRPSSFQEIADWLKMQSSDEIRDRILSRMS